MPQTPVKFGTIPNFARLPAAGSVPIRAADPGARLMVTLRQRRRPGAPLPLPAPGAPARVPANSRHCMSREDYAQQHGAAAADFDAVKAFATVHGLTVAESKRWRSCSSNSLLYSHHHSRSRLLFRGSAFSRRHVSTRHVNKNNRKAGKLRTPLHRGSCGMPLDLLRLLHRLSLPSANPEASFSFRSATISLCATGSLHYN
jgi:hypothetical protein